LPRPRADLQALLRAKDDAREGGRGLRALRGRLRDAGRAVRVAGADPDRDDPALPGGSRRHRALARAPRLDRGEADRRAVDRAGGSAAPLDDGRSRGDRASRARLLSPQLRARDRGRGGRSLLMELRDLPSVDELARDVDDPLAVEAARAVIDRAREEIHAGADPGDLRARLDVELAAARAPRLRRVLNATGVVVHT